MRAMDPFHDAGSEQVDIVDDDDVVIDVVSRARMRKDRLCHRAVFVVVIDDAGRILVHRRSESKDVWPGWFDLAVGGVVGAGETYDDAARRELREELGVCDAEISPFDDGKPRRYVDEVVDVFARCYVVRHCGPFVFSDGEIVDARWSTWEELRVLVRDEKFLPDSRHLLFEELSRLLDDR